jgi:hypothetical protein
VIMLPAVRKFALSMHVTSSVGWLGAVAGFLTLAVAGLTSRDEQLVRASYLAMELTAWAIIVPLSLASPLTGVIQSLGTSWGLFRHYWVLVKLLITIPATLVLLIHMRPIGHLARVVAETTLTGGELAGLRIQMVADAGAAVLVLLVATALSIYKPRGLTPYGQRMPDEENSNDAWSAGSSDVDTPGRPRWVSAFGIIALLLILAFVIRHLVSGTARGH